MKFPDKVYDFLKWMCLILLPALNTFLGVILPGFGLADDSIKLIITVVSAFSAFIGTLIGISNVAYKAEKNNSPWK